MILYSIILFFVSLVFLILGIAVCKGKTDLIHSYHQENVTDKTGYGKAFGKALLALAGSMLASGALALLGEKFTTAALIILFAGLAVGLVCIDRVQKKYNGGWF